MSTRGARRIITCSSCGKDGQHEGRGLCGTCYSKARREWRREKNREKLADRPDLDFWSRDLLLHEVEFFTEWCGMKPSDVPRRLGWNRDRFETAMRRARKAGEPRALRYWELVEREKGRAVAEDDTEEEVAA